MPHKPVAPLPDTIEPRSPAEMPDLHGKPEEPGRCGPEQVCPPDPTYTPDSAPPEQPAPDPDI